MVSRVPTTKLPKGVYVSRLDDIRPWSCDSLVDHLGPPTGKGLVKIVLPREAVGTPGFEVEWLRVAGGGGVMMHHHRTETTRELYFVTKGTLRIVAEGMEDVLLTEGGMAYFDNQVTHGLLVESPEAEYLVFEVWGGYEPRTGDVVDAIKDAGITIAADGTMTFSEMPMPKGHPHRK